MIPKVAKVIGFVGGVIAVIWAMRDRFISVAISREPQPPAFRSHPPAPTPPADSSRDLESINGIGPTYATRLRAAGFESPADLAAADLDDVAAAAGVSPNRARSWVEAAADA